MLSATTFIQAASSLEIGESLFPTRMNSTVTVLDNNFAALEVFLE